MRDLITDIKNWFEAAVPASTSTREKRMVQLGVHFEEVSEMLESIGLDHMHMSTKADLFKARSYPYDETKVDRKALLDALCDQIVTAVGVAHMHGLDVEEGLRRVNASNWSKFGADGKPQFDLNGKIKKSENYVKPDLNGLF